MLQNINTTLSEKIKVNEWKNTESVINRFKSIRNKHLYKILMFGIKDFYPSIKAVMGGDKICQTSYFYN